LLERNTGVGVFLSFASLDLDQAELVVSLLEFHGIEVWFSETTLRSGKFPIAIAEALVSSDALIVLVSKNALSSEWVASEVSTFARGRPSSPILPVVTDETKPSHISKALAEHQYFKLNMTGLGKLFSSLNIQFLQRKPRAPDRRAESERRKIERRKSNPETRLRKGLWLLYYKVKESDKFEPISCSRYALIETQGIVLDEATRYRFVDRESKMEVEPGTVLRVASERVWHKMKQKPLGAIFVLEAIASEMCWNNDVYSLNRRQASDRRQATTRRAKGAGT
jgi:hypothetical protein